MSKCVAVVFVLSSLAVNPLARVPQQTGRTNLTGESTALSSPHGDSKEFVFYRIRSLVEDISAFQNTAVKANALSQIADIVWPQDEQYTRALFDTALGLTAPGGDAKNSRALLNLRQDIIARIAKRDAEWAKLLIDGTPDGEDEKQGAAAKRESNIETAKRLQKEDPKLAAEFASRSLQGGVSAQMVWFLKNLRRQDEAAADLLFAQALNQLARQPPDDLGAFAMFGTYLFTSPRLDGGDPANVMITRVGDVGVVDITADLPEAPPRLVRAYLQTAISILRHPTADPHQRKMGYALAHLLLPKARRFAPDLVAPLGAASADLSAGVPPAMTHESAFTHINKKTVDSPEQIMARAEKLPDSQSRDVAYLDVAFQSWLKKDFATAQTACGKIEDKDARARLETLIEFGRASSKIRGDGRQLLEAAEAAEKLPQGIERAVLYLGISETAFKNKDAALSNDSAARARKAALSVTDSRKPYLLLLSAGQLARHDPAAAEAAFADAIKGFNAADGGASPAVAWHQKVEVGDLVERFPLAVAGLDFSFNKAFSAALPVTGIEGGISRARELKSEQLRMSAFVALTGELLKSIPQESRAGGVVIRVGEDGMRRSAEKTVMPAYPEDALKKGQQGVAVVEAQYDGKGEVTDTSVLEAPSPSIGQAAAEAVGRWKFKPSTLEGKPISVRGKLTFYFVIGEDRKGRVENPKQFQ